MKHLVTALVAVAVVALSLAHGGFSHELIAAGAVAIWFAIVVTLATRVWPRSPIPGSAIAAGICLALFAAWTALSIAWASDDGAAFFEGVRVLAYLGLFVLVVIVSPAAGARSWLAGVALGLTAVAGLALVSRFEPSFAGQEVIGRFLPTARGRLSYPIGYWNGLGASMALGFVLLVWLGGHARTRTGRALAVAALPLPMLTIYLASSRGGVVAAAIGCAALLALGPGRARMLAGLALGGAGGAALILIASGDHALVDDLRNAVAARQGDDLLMITIGIVAAIGVVRLLVDRPLADIRVPRPLVGVTLAAAAIVLAIGAVVADPSERWDEFQSVPPVATKRGYVASHLASGGGSGRYQYWSAALDAFESDPIKGIGAGGYQAWWNQHGSLALPIQDAHSLLFETLGELGVVGLALLLAFIGVAMAAGLRQVPSRWHGGEAGAALALLVTGVVSAGIDWTWELPAVFAPAVVAAALLTGPAAASAGHDSGVGTSSAGGAASEPLASGARLGLGVATLAVGTVAFLIAWLSFLTEARLGDSQDAAARGDLATAAQDASDASNIQPWASAPHLQLALVEELAGDLAAANGDIDKAVERAPDDWRLWFVKARLEVKSGDVDAARRALDRARELNPRAPFFAR